MSWWIRVYSEPGERDDTLACWEADDGRWLTEMVAAGKLQQLKRGGYPSLYRGAASELLPILQALDKHFPGEMFTKHQERIDGFPPDRELTVALWDQS